MSDSDKNSLCGLSGQPNVQAPERIASGILGAGLLAYAAKRRDAAGALLGVLGGGMIFRAASGYCPAYDMLRTGTNTFPDKPGNVIPYGQGIRVEKSITIQKSPEELFSFWRDFENLPRIMDHLEEVKVTGDKTSHWKAKAPLGRTVEWDAEIINEIRNELIAWKSKEDADVPNTGSVTFKPAVGDGTVVKVNLTYTPPAGLLGATIAKLFGEEPGVQVDEDLRRFKSLMETGEIPTIEGQPQSNKEGRSQDRPVFKATL